MNELTPESLVEVMRNVIVNYNNISQEELCASTVLLKTGIVSYVKEGQRLHLFTLNPYELIRDNTLWNLLRFEVNRVFDVEMDIGVFIDQIPELDENYVRVGLPKYL